MTLAYRVIRSEHYEINLVVKCLDNLADALHRGIWKPDFDLLFLILDYLEGFPATFHHPKEEDYLFKAVRLRSPNSAPMLDELCNDHAEGLGLTNELRQSLETYIGRPAARGSYCNVARRLARNEREHMQREERMVLPLALRVLSNDDWQEIDAAFDRKEQPLLGPRRREQFDKLFAHILRRMPGEVGFEQNKMKVA